MAAAARLFASARLIAVLTLVSRLFGLARECMFGYYFGTSPLMSSFRIAFMAPNLARRLFGEGALSSSMIPILTETLQTEGEAASRRFVGSLMSLVALMLMAGVLVVEGVIAVWRTFHDNQALELTAILMPYMVLICLVAVGGGVLNVRRHFATPAAVSILLNAVMIAGILFGRACGGSDLELMYALCASVLLAGVAQLGVIAAALRAERFFPVSGGSWRDPQVRRVFTLMAPMALGLSVVQINSLADYLIAYLFVYKDGKPIGPAVLGFAQYLYEMPLGVFGIALATAIFPVLAKKAAERDHAGLAETVLRGVRLGAFIALPATVGLVVVARPLVRTLLEHGEFPEEDTPRVAATVAFYSLGLTAYFAQHVVVRAYYALQDSRTPARVAAWMVLADFVMNLSLVFVMEERGLALSTAVCAVIQVVWLGLRLQRVLPGLRWARLARACGPMLLAAAAMGAALAVPKCVATVRGVFAARPPVELSVQVVIGVVVYVAAAYVLRIEELGVLVRLRRTERPPAPARGSLPG